MASCQPSRQLGKRARRRRTPGWIALLAAVSVLVGTASSFAKDGDDDAVRSAVFRVEVSRARRDWTAPWKLLPTETLSGTAFLIEGDRLITNAHVVRDAQQVTVKKNDGSAPTLATVESIEDECDLAVLRVSSASFLHGLHPLRWGDLPAIGSNVVAYGYPIGGEQLSTTAGVVSRIENHQYGATIGFHLAVQTDAAINPGNSGGPVLQRGAVIGISFQVMSGSQNIGYFIPVPVVRHFLADVASGHDSGFPDLPIRTLPLTSPAFRRERRVPDDRSGVIIQEIAAGSDVDGLLAPGDVLMSVDGQRVADDGTCQIGAVRVPFTHLVDMKAVGQTARLEVWRDGKPLTVVWKSSRFAPWLRLRRAGSAPRYFLYGGLLFVPATIEYFAALFPTGARRAAIFHDFALRLWERPADLDHEMVLLAHVFANPANAGFDTTVPFVVERVNGQSVKNLADLARLLNDGNPRYDVFELGPFHHVEAIDRQQARSARATIQATYGISNDQSL